MAGFSTDRKRVALVGSAPSSVQLAPYGHPEWFIVGCSPGAYGFAGPHAHAWMEIHRWEPQVAGHAGTGQSWFSPEYVEFLVRFGGDVWMVGAEPWAEFTLPPEVPNAKAVPVHDLMQEFGPYFFTSSLSWMFALAILTPGVEEIGLWGVDMAAGEEWGLQRPGCQFFIQEAFKRGIEVTVPPESDLLQPPLAYGVSEYHPMHVKLTARRRELEARLARAQQMAASANNETNFLQGALDDINYMMQTWVTTAAWLPPVFGKTGNEVRAVKQDGPRSEVMASDRTACEILADLAQDGNPT